MQTLFLKKNEDRRIRAGHLWVFSNEIDVKRSPLTGFVPGEAATVCDGGGRPLGTAYVNPASLISARLVSHKAENPLNGDMLRHRLEQALRLRERLFEHPWYRLCHGEGDGLPGLVVDRFGDHLTVQITTAGMDVHKDTLVQVLADVLKPASVLLRNDVGVRELENLPLVVETALGTPPDAVEVRENGALFTVPLAQGQKTGWFFDQRSNRCEAARYAGKARVLDAFCYAGAFGVVAARAGAASVAFLDASRPALEAATANFAANTLAFAPDCSMETLPGDALGTLAALRDEGRRFDVVCLDPPAFIKRRKDAVQGLEAYRRVNDLGLQLVEDGGVLVTCSCSHHLEADALRRLVAQSCARRGLMGQVLYQGFQGPDHPIHPAMPETAYLKCFIVRVHRA